MTRVLLSLALVLTTLLFATAPASAQTCIAPPGTAAVDQYCENVPSAGGNGGGPSGGSSARPSQGTVRALARSGQGGKELNRFLGADVASAQGTTGSSKRSSSGRKAAKQATTAPAPRQPSSSPLGAVQSAVNSGATIGDAFIWILLGIALFIAGTAWLRHRTRATE
jgi:hypothetical protein